MSRGIAREPAMTGSGGEITALRKSASGIMINRNSRNIVISGLTAEKHREQRSAKPRDQISNSVLAQNSASVNVGGSPIPRQKTTTKFHERGQTSCRETTRWTTEIGSTNAFSRDSSFSVNQVRECGSIDQVFLSPQRDPAGASFGRDSIQSFTRKYPIESPSSDNSADNFCPCNACFRQSFFDTVMLVAQLGMIQPQLIEYCGH